MKSHWIAVALSALIVSGCGARGAVETNPTTQSASNYRALAERALREIDFGLTAVDGIRPLINSIPDNVVSVDVKQKIRCSILRGIGLPSQGVSASDSAVLLKVCGSLPAQGKSALDVAVAELKATSSCVGLATTLQRAIAWLQPFISELDASKDAGLRYAALSIRTGMAFTIAFASGGGQCS